jgi:ABC-2 type transport system ATP-binding protein
VAELERVCDYLIVLRAGRVRLAGDIDELRSRHRARGTGSSAGRTAGPTAAAGR